MDLILLIRSWDRHSWYQSVVRQG